MEHSKPPYVHDQSPIQYLDARLVDWCTTSPDLIAATHIIPCTSCSLPSPRLEVPECNWYAEELLF